MYRWQGFALSGRESELRVRGSEREKAHTEEVVKNNEESEKEKEREGKITRDF